MVPLLRMGPSVPCVRFVAEGLLVHALHTLYADKIRPTLSEVRGAPLVGDRLVVRALGHGALRHAYE